MAQPFTKIKKYRNLYEDVVKEIKVAVLSGRYPIGSALPSETQLAEQFGVSRPVVREALRYLQSRGLVEIRRGTKGGAFVCDTFRHTFLEDFSDLILYRHVKVEHLTQARLLIEPEVSRLAALNATTRDIAAMKELVRQYGVIKNPDEKDKMYALFHRLVGRCCGNPLYAQLMESIMDFTEGFIRIIKPVSKFIHRDDDHDEIIDAFEKHDPAKAAEVATRHAHHILEEMHELETTYLALLEQKEEPISN